MISSLKNNNTLKFSALVFERYPGEEIVIGHQVRIKAVRRSPNDGAEITVTAPSGVWVRNIGYDTKHAGPNGDTFTATVRRVVDRANKKAVIPTVEIGTKDPKTGAEKLLAKLVAPRSLKNTALKLGIIAPSSVQVDRAEVYQDKLNTAMDKRSLTLNAMTYYVAPNQRKKPFARKPQSRI